MNSSEKAETTKPTKEREKDSGHLRWPEPKEPAKEETKDLPQPQGHPPEGGAKGEKMGKV